VRDRLHVRLPVDERLRMSVTACHSGRTAAPAGRTREKLLPVFPPVGPTDAPALRVTAPPVRLAVMAKITALVAACLVSACGGNGGASSNSNPTCGSIGAEPDAACESPGMRCTDYGGTPNGNCYCRDAGWICGFHP
jgi:hypothetical protein